VLWLVPLAIGLVGLATLAFLASRVRRELAPTMAVVDRFGREHRVEFTNALEHLRDDTAQAHAQLPD
jgi:hypothetical protein